MKLNHLQVWPDISGYLPAIRPFNIQESRGKDLKILFNKCTSIDSTGLNFLVLNILQILKKSKNISGWKCKSKINDANLEIIKRLGFFKILTQYSHTSDIFWSDIELIGIEPIVTIDMLGIKKVSYPIYSILFNEYKKRRDALLPFKQRLYDIFEKISLDYEFSFEHLISIINEIAKNSADHTDNICLFGLDILIPQKGNNLKITFSIGDLGIGINENIKENLKEHEISRYSFWDFSQTYRKALKTGVTSKPDSKENRGIGMSIIINGSKNIGLELLIFDARSGGTISEIDIEKLCHERIRENFYSFNRKFAFYYYGELYLRKKDDSN